MTESLDTNILLRIILRDDEKLYQIARKLITRPNIEFHIADLAITEIVYILQTKKYTRNEIKKHLESIFSWPNINYNHALFANVLPFYATHPSLSFNDCCLSTYAALNQSEPLWTFDRKLAIQSPTAKQAT